MRARVLTDAADLAGVEAAWWELFARVPDASPFSSPAWLLPWWQAFGPGELHTVAIEADGRLVGLAPLWIEDGRRGRRLLPLGLGLSDHLDVLLEPGLAPEAGALLAETLGQAGSWERWCAEEAAPGATVLAVPDPPGWRSMVAPQSACPVLAAAPGRLALAVPAPQRRKLRMARHRADRRGWSIVDATPATLAGDLGHLWRLHGARWHSRGETGVLSERAVRRFHEAAAPALLAAGLLRLSVLRLGDAVAGVFYGLSRGRGACAYLGGFDPAYSFESPGTLLIGAAIETADAEGREVFDFLRGQEPYKYRWGAADRWNACRIWEPIG